jgi:dipeptidyl aminopeptidase B
MTSGEGGIGRQLLSVPIPGAADQELAGPTALTSNNTSPPSHYSAAFSPQAGFYLLSYEGPGIPWQKLININNQSTPYSRNSLIVLTNLFLR